MKKIITTMGDLVDKDDLLVVITARIGTVSYKPAFENLPKELTSYYPLCSLMIIYPDQNGQQQDVMTFTAPQRIEQASAYATLTEWLRNLKK